MKNNFNSSLSSDVTQQLEIILELLLIYLIQLLEKCQDDVEIYKLSQQRCLFIDRINFHKEK